LNRACNTSVAPGLRSTNRPSHCKL
jgi:hypothetical protein